MDMMAIRRRVMMASKKKRLPSEYQEVEWIEKTARNSYIKTGVIGNGELLFTCKMLITQVNNGAPFFGSYGRYQRCYLLLQNNGGKIGCSYVTSDYADIVLTKDVIYDAITDFKVGEQKLTINGVDVLNTSKQNTLRTDRELYLFGYNYDGTFDDSRSSYIKLYSATITQDGVLVRNFVPCYRKSDGEIGMYDTVSKTFYANSGTDVFTKGADV